MKEWTVSTITAFCIVAALLVIGQWQVNQYKEVVDRIDRNTAAVTCIIKESLHLPAEDRTGKKLDRIIRDCFDKYDL